MHLPYFQPMKNLFLLIAIFIGLSQSQAQKVEWMSFEEAVEANEKEPRKLLIDVYTDWCGWCKKMDKDTYAHPIIAKYINENYYPVKFNAETTDTIVLFDTLIFVNPNPKGRRSSHQLAVSLLGGKMSYPTTLFMNEEVKILQKVPGYLDAKAIEPILYYFNEDGHLTVPYEEFKKNFDSFIKEEEE